MSKIVAVKALFSVSPSAYSVIYPEKMCPLFEQILIMCLSASGSRFCFPLIAKRCAGDKVAVWHQIFVFWKAYISHRRGQLFVDARPYFRILNSIGKKMTIYLRDKNKFWGTAHSARVYYNADSHERYQTNTVHPFWGSRGASALKHFGVDHFSRYCTKIYGKQKKIKGTKF